MKRPFLVLAAVALLAGCSKSPDKHAATPAPPAVSVTLARVTAADSPVLTEITGTVRPARQATIAAKIMGSISDLPVALGQHVAAGDLLVQLSAREIDARLAQAHAQRNTASRDLERERALLARGASTGELVRNLEDRLAGSEALVREAEAMRGYTELRAPFAGVIARKHADTGDLAAPGQPLLELDGIDNFQVEAPVPDSLAAPLAVGQPLTVIAPSTSRRLDGTLLEISSAVDSAARAVSVKIALPAGSGVRSGQFVRVLLPGPAVRALLVPASAVSRVGQMERVFVAGSDGRAVLRLVKTGAVRGDRIEIVSGLEEGESVVAAPPAGMREGQPLEVRS